MNADQRNKKEVRPNTTIRKTSEGMSRGFFLVFQSE